MLEIFLVVGVDQDGDAHWRVRATKAEAMADRGELAELAFNPPDVWRLDLTDPSLPAYKVW